MLHFIHFKHLASGNPLSKLYANMALRSFALSLIGIFVPVYLLSKNYSLNEVFLFFLIIAATHACMAIPATRFAFRFGYSAGALASIPFLVAAYIFIGTIEQFHWPLFYISLLFGIGDALFWMAYHSDFAECSINEKVGEEVGYMRIVNVAAAAVAPLLGGGILLVSNFNVLIMIVSGILFISTVPLFFIQKNNLHKPFSLKDIFCKETLKNNFLYAVHGFDQGLGGIVWPIFTYLAVLHSFTLLGFSVSISLIVSLFTIYIIGKLSNRFPKEVLHVGVLGTSLTWIARGFLVTTSFGVYAANIAGGLFNNLVTIPFSALVYKSANGHGSCNALIAREICYHLGLIVLYIFLIATTSFFAAFFIGIFLPLLLLLY